MKRQLLNKILSILFLFPIYLFAQPSSSPHKDITGLWKGSLYNDTTRKNLPYEIAISEENGKLSGYSYTLFDIDGKKEIGVKRIKIKRNEDVIIIEDVELISHDYSAPPPRKVRQQSIVTLSVNDTAMQLTGKWRTNRTKEYSSLTGSLQLQRAINYRPLALFKKLMELKLDKDLSFVKAEKKRETDIAINEKPTTEIKLPVAVPSQSADADKPKEIAATITDKKTDLVVENKPANKVIKPSGEPVEKSAVGKPAKTADPLPGNKTSVKIAVNESAKKENKPSAEIDKQPATNEKLTTITAPVVNNKTAPVTAIKDPVKSESRSTTVAITQPDQKKALPVEVAATIVSVPAANVSERKMNKEQFVFFESDSLVLTLYDNGDVDGDTVSVIMNGQIIFAKQGLSTKANSKTIYMDKGMPDSLSMVMYAENLGGIPPNTGLLVIMDGEKRYEVRFSADLKTNAGILLRRRTKKN